MNFMQFLNQERETQEEILREYLKSKPGKWICGTASIGVLVGIGIAMISRGVDRPVPVPSQSPPPVVSHHAKLDAIIDGHLDWAAHEDVANLDEVLLPIRQFFEQSRQGSQGFAEEVLGFNSKWRLAKDYVTGEQDHGAFIEQCFAKHIFEEDQLDALVESVVEAQSKHLSDVDSVLLVRLQADLADLPASIFPSSVEPETMKSLLQKAIVDARESAEVDIRRSVGRELVSLIAGEVVANAAARLATSAGIIGVGTGSSILTFGGGVAIGFLVDAVVSKAYDAYYDPAGEIARQLNSNLQRLETLILQGSDDSPGLEQHLRDYSGRRNQARTLFIRSAITP